MAHSLAGGRRTYVEFGGRKMTQGVPQSGDHSPNLFNLHMSKLPLRQPRVNVVPYADYNIAVFSSRPKIAQLSK